jgi:ribose/xylose/arabinose/galactoside ABC-type transport system permease subunit
MRYRAFLLVVLLAILVGASTSSPQMAIIVLGNWTRSALPLVPLALAAALIISCGQIDIASGAAFSFVGMIIIALTEQQRSGTSSILGLVVAWLAVVLFYLIMYFLIVLGRVPALLCTLGMALCGESISLQLQAYITRRALNAGPITGVAGMTISPNNLSFFSWNIAFVFPVVGLLVLWRYLSNAGLDHIAVGIDPTASRISGVNTNLVYLRAFLFSGVLVGLSAVLFLVNVQLGGWATNMGWGKELFAIAAAVIGGCRITGGRFDPVCVALATVLVFGITDITNALNVPLEWDYLIVGTGVVAVGLIDGVHLKTAART